MVARRIEVEPDSDLARLLDSVRDQSVILELEGQRFRLRQVTIDEDDSKPTADAQRAIQGMKEAQGILTQEQAEE